MFFILHNKLPFLGLTCWRFFAEIIPSPVPFTLVKWSAAGLGKVVKSPKVVQSDFFCENTHSHHLNLKVCLFQLVCHLFMRQGPSVSVKCENFWQASPTYLELLILQHIHLHHYIHLSTKYTIPNTSSQVQNTPSQIPKLTIPNIKYTIPNAKYII